MEDKTDNLIENDDLLGLLMASTGDSSEDKSGDDSTLGDSSDMSEDDSREADKRMQELSKIASEFGSAPKAIGANPGSGDIDQDLVDWFSGQAQLPSDPLNIYVSNAIPKLDYGSTRHTLGNYTKMSKLGSFLDESFDILFDASNVSTLMPDELVERTKIAFTMFKDYFTMNRQTLHDMKENRLKTGGDDVDKLTLLLSSIPEERLKAILTEITK